MRAASDKRVPEHFEPEDMAIDIDMRTKAEKIFISTYRIKIDMYMQPHNQVLGIIKHDYESFNIRVLPLSSVWLQPETKRDKLTNKKRKIGDGLSVVVDEEEEAVQIGRAHV